MIKLTESSGRIIIQFVTSDAVVELPTSEFSPGVYIIMIISGGRIQTLKFVKAE
jgi:hypothetical protein